MAESSSKWRRRALWCFIVVVVGVLVACCGGLIYFADKPTNGIRVEEIEADARERLPVGSSWQDAEAWFASHQLTPHAVVDGAGRKIGLGAHVPNDTLTESAEIQVYFYFGDDEKLRERIVRRLVFSL